MQRTGERRRNGGFKLLLRGGRKIADGAHRTRFVLHLDHDDGVLCAVNLFQVVEQRGEGMLVGLEVGGRVW